MREFQFPKPTTLAARAELRLTIFHVSPLNTPTPLRVQVREHGKETPAKTPAPAMKISAARLYSEEGVGLCSSQMQVWFNFKKVTPRCSAEATIERKTLRKHSAESSASKEQVRPEGVRRRHHLRVQNFTRISQEGEKWIWPPLQDCRG